MRDGAVIEANSTDPKIQGVRRFNEMLGSEPRVTATAIQTVGSKGYDGFAIALVTSDERNIAEKQRLLKAFYNRNEG